MSMKEKNNNDNMDKEYVKISKKTIIISLSVIAGASISGVLCYKLKMVKHETNKMKVEKAIETILEKSKEQGIIKYKINGYVKCGQNIEHIKAREAEYGACEDVVNIKLKEILDLIK